MTVLTTGDRVLVTGAGGFIGSAVTRTLVEKGCRVAALLEPGSDSGNLDGVDVDRVTGDLRDGEAVERAAHQCRAVFHVAALYRFWAAQPGDFYAVNVDGTRNVLRAARSAGVERVVFTSTVGTLGVSAGRRADESSYPELSHLFGSYKRSKYVAEHEVLRAGAEGLDVSLVLPTFPVGPGDRAPTPSGRVVRDFLKGRMPGFVDTVLNVAHVDDVAAGHILAFEKGAAGRSYILGGENLTMQELLARLAAVTGLPAPRLRVPHSVAVGAAWLSETVEGRILGRHPTVPLEAARMSGTRMAFDDARARNELGYSPRPAVEALLASARWYVDHGYVSPGRVRRIHWGGT